MTLELITQIFQICVIPLLGILTKFVIDFLTAQRDKLNADTESEIAKKYTSMIFDTVTRCVIATNQTYVDALKKEGKFDAEAQKVAFNKTMQAVLAVLSDDAKQYIQEATGDVNTYLTQLIESLVNEKKTEVPTATSFVGPFGLVSQ